MITLTWKRFSDDNSFSYYLGNTFLSHADTQDEAKEEAVTIIRAYQNGAVWARNEFPELCGKV